MTDQDRERAASLATTQASTVFHRLRSDILCCVWSPGQRLRLDQLRTAYGAGGSPIREALNRLVAEGLVVQIDQRGFRVAPVTRSELSDLTRARAWLGERALSESLRNGDAAWEERVLLTYHRWERGVREAQSPAYMHNGELHALHKAFHAAMLSACGSDWFLRYWDNSFEAARRYQVLSLKFDDHGERDPIGEHRALRDAVLARDEERALQLHHDHVVLTATMLEASQGDDELFAVPPRLSISS
ncbi:GntR family transcriptional regulator [Sphingopyxis kveilinensis]|uniref:GntR family transcriptional regulator n=1 Tax=Sphingopyxis kveilinensis TaxID=3114367 RepID=UPI0030CD65A1